MNNKIKSIALPQKDADLFFSGDIAGFGVIDK